MKHLNFVLCLVCTLSISSAAHALTLRTVALSGQQVPGAPDGVVFGGFTLNGPPVLNDAGQTAFRGSYLNGSNVGTGILSEGSGSLQLVAAQGQQAPGMPDGVTYDYFFDNPRIVINDAGAAAFAASFTGSGTNSGGIWSSGPGGSALVARAGEQVAGMPYLVDNNVGLRTFLANDAGQVAFPALVGGNRGILAQRHGSLEIVARTGTHAPGTPDGVNFSDVFSPFPISLNNLGQTAFGGQLTGSGVDSTNDRGLWSEGSGSLALVAREGSQAPGMPDGAVFNIGFSSLDLNNAGQTAFIGFVAGGGVDATNNFGIWLGASGSLSLVVRSGTPAPGTPSGVNFGGFTNMALNDAGQLAIGATLAGGGRGLWSGAPGSLALVARTGEHAPGTEDGVVFSSFFNAQTLTLNAAGQTAFKAQLAGSGISASNDVGIWATDRSGALQLIAREGDLLEVAPGDFRTVADFLRFLGDLDANTMTGNGDGRPSAFNNLGQLAFLARFTDGTSGIFVSNRVAVPEPSTVALVAAGLLGIVGCARRRQRHRSDPQNSRTTTTLRARRSDGDSCGTLISANSR